MKKALVAILSLSFIASAVEVKDAWVRAVPPVSKNSAAYMKLYNNKDKENALIKAYSDVAKITELHKTVRKGSMEKMIPVKEIPIAPKSTVELKPGGYHIMLIHLKKPLKIGQKVKITLYFKDGEKKVIEAPVKK